MVGLKQNDFQWRVNKVIKVLKMGKKLSKQPRKSKTDSAKLSNGVQNVQQEERYEIDDPEKYHLEAIEILKKEFKEDPEMFILNMLLMSFMFFDNYQT